MSTFLDKLNLRPQERRLVVGGAAVLFIVLQFWLVWPHFNDWNRVNAGLDKAKSTLKTYQSDIARTNEYQLKLEQLEREGTSALAEERAQPNIMRTEIDAQVKRSKLNPGNITHVPSARTAAAKTNRFFEEQIFTLGVNPTGDEELVDFLVAMGSSELMIRVKNLDLRPELPTRYRLMGSMTLVASFQKNSSTKPGPLSAAKP